ncbi:MAG TPA: C40 family peptidase [Candidatus Acidoferrum sp.]|jgi:cell wall-associated NlpC family hydrolase|nr:C40 family peptidase [Candidatus Acidoferrum sp.]
MVLEDLVRDFARALTIAAAKWSVGCVLGLLASSIALTACSSVSGRPPERDRSIATRGTDHDQPEPDARTPRLEGPMAAGPRQTRGLEQTRGQRAAHVAMKYRGAPYRWGSAGPAGFDCSGFVRYVYAHVGVSLPHNAAMQYEYGTPVSRDGLEPGDLVFFDRLRHNGIYIGQGRFIHARQTGKRVDVATLDEDWYRSRWVGARRLGR